MKMAHNTFLFISLKMDKSCTSKWISKLKITFKASWKEGTINGYQFSRSAICSKILTVERVPTIQEVSHIQEIPTMQRVPTIQR